jgi:hypothetical protein
MDELDIQTAIVKNLKDRGHFGHKLAHKFLVGVPDLLVQVRKYGSAILEVKFETYAVPLTTIAISTTLFVPQWRFLRNVHNSGMAAGLLCFAGTTWRNLHAALEWFDELPERADNGPDKLVRYQLDTDKFEAVDPRTERLVTYLQTRMKERTGAHAR